MKLNPNQIHAISMLASGATAKAVAESVGVTPQTICEWRKNAIFEASLNELKWDALHFARDTLRCSAQAAVDGLKSLAAQSQNDEVRRKACNDILTLIGMSDPGSGLLGWGIGSPDPDCVFKDREINEKIMETLKDMKKMI